MDPRNDEATARLDVIVIGGGQTGLALGFFLVHRRIPGKAARIFKKKYS